MAMEVGMVCMKVSGREGGNICTIVKKVDKSFVEITGPRLVTGVKRRRCNIAHLEPVGMFMEIGEGANDEDIIEAYKKAGVITKFNLKLPSAAELKSVKEKVEIKKEKTEAKTKEK